MIKEIAPINAASSLKDEGNNLVSLSLSKATNLFFLTASDNFSKNISPLFVIPPLNTITLGSNNFISISIATPKCCIASLNISIANSSPALAASTTIFAVIFSIPLSADLSFLSFEILYFAISAIP